MQRSLYTADSENGKHTAWEKGGHNNFWAESLVSKCQNMNSLVKWFGFIVDAETSSNVPVLQLQVNKHAENSTQIFVQISAFRVFRHRFFFFFFKFSLAEISTC